MLRYGQVYKPEPDPYVDLRIRDDFSGIVSQTEYAIDALNKAIDVLPFVAEDGQSKCDIAETLFAQKEEAEHKLRAREPYLQKYLTAIEDEQSKREGERETISADAAGLALDAPRDYYDKALVEQEKRCNEILEQRSEMLHLINRVKAALSRAAGYKWPLGVPKKPFQLPDMPMVDDGVPPVGEMDFPPANEVALPPGPAAATDMPPAGPGPDMDGLLDGGLLDVSLPRYPFENPGSDFGYGSDF